MTRIALVIGTFLAVPVTLPAQTTDEAIARAIMAAPGRAAAEAGVISWNENGDRVVLRESTNGVVCWDRSGVAGQRAFAVQCTNEGNIERFEQNRAFFKAGKDRDGWNALVAAAEKDGTRKVAVYGSVYYSMSGDTMETARTHMTIAVPFATAESLDLPAE